MFGICEDAEILKLFTKGEEVRKTGEREGREEVR